MPIIDKTEDDDFILRWAQGDTVTRRMSFTEDGSPKQLTGTVYFVVDERNNPPLGDASTRKFVINGTIVGDGSTGEVDLTPVNLQTVIPAGTYYGMIQIDNSGSIETLVKLRVEIVSVLSPESNITLGIATETNSSPGVTP